MTSRRLFLVLLVVCAFVASAAPRAQTPPQTTPVAAAQTPKITMAGYPAPGEPAAVTLLSAGTGTKKQLRYSVAADFKGRMDMTTTMAMSVNVMGNAMDMPIPTMTMGVDLAVTGIAANGDITYNVAFTGVTLDGDTSSPAGQAMQAALGGVSSIKGTTTMSNRGQTKSTKLDVPDPSLQQMMDQMSTSIENLAAALPEEAVGVGARWEVRQALTGGGQTQFQKAVYEVVAIDGQSVSLKVTSEQSAPPQPVNNAAAAATGAEMTLDKMTGTGTGAMTIKLDSLVPTSSMDVISSTAMTMNMAGQSMAVTTDGKIKVTIAPGKAK